jgi:hypothetical protein
MLTTHERTSAEESDHALVAGVADVVRRPRDRPADSFILHAPLELAARAALLPYVDSDRRAVARQRIIEIATAWEAFAAPIVDPVPSVLPRDLDAAVVQLDRALATGDLDAADAAAIVVARDARADELRRLLGDSIVTSTAAAAHAPIFLYHLPRVSPRGELTSELLRPLARELARNPDWHLRWMETWMPTAPTADRLFDALVDTPFVGMGESNFIHPTMMRVDPTGVAERQLRDSIPIDDLDSATRAILRVAALSMVVESDAHAPYGWSHCLTMPQAVLGIAARTREPSRAIAVAATYVVGFRATLAEVPIQRDFTPRTVDVGWFDALSIDSKTAAAAVWHAPESDDNAISVELANRASVAADAHLVKYTLACIDAAAFDRQARRLYLSAAANLVGWWAQRTR